MPKTENMSKKDDYVTDTQEKNWKRKMTSRKRM